MPINGHLTVDTHPDMGYGLGQPQSQDWGPPLRLPGSRYDAPVVKVAAAGPSTLMVPARW